MPTPRQPSHPTGPSRALLSAALGALVWASSTACAGKSSDPGSSSGSSGTTQSASFTCDGGVSPSPAVTSSSVVALSQQDFANQCSAANGVFEIQPHCGGLNNCRGMSYDTGTQTLTQHTCRGTNTCAGYSCVVCD